MRPGRLHAHGGKSSEEAPSAAPAKRDDGNDARRRRPRRPRGPDSPDGKWTAVVKDFNLYLREKESGKEFALSQDGKADDAYTGEAFWSPDGKKLVGLREKPGDERKVYLIESAPSDQVQPKLSSYDYLKPGDRVPVVKPHLFDVGAKKEIPVADDLFPNPWSIEEYRWAADSSRFTFLYNQRGHQVLRVVAVDAETGKATAVIDEQSKTFIDYSGKMYFRRLDATDEILWMSERDGWNHLYLYDAKTGQVKNQVTKGEWVVRGVDRVDEKERQVWFHAGGIYPNQDPYYVHYGRVNFDGTGLTFLTEGDGTHAVQYSPDGRFLIDTYSRVDMAPVTELRSVKDGKRVCELERADMSGLLATGWKPPEPFAAKGRDGKTDICGVIYRPTNLRSGEEVPSDRGHLRRPAGLLRSQAIPLVPRGPGAGRVGLRRRADRRHGHVEPLQGVPRRLLEEPRRCRAAGSHPVDEGGGGQVSVHGLGPRGHLRHVGRRAERAGALLFHPEFYKAGVAECGCHDNRMDKIWWNEQWMGWPVGPQYAEQSNVTNAHKLRGKLLLIVGEMDHNVDPASTMQVVNALDQGGQGLRPAGGPRRRPRHGRRLRRTPDARFLRPPSARRRAA